MNYIKKAESHRNLRQTYHPAIVTNGADITSYGGNFFFDKRRLKGAHSQSQLNEDYPE
jgi:hypothetical protein